MDKWIISHSGALRVFGDLIPLFIIVLVITVALLIFIKIRQAANQRLESSKGNTRFAKACSKTLSAASREPSRNPVCSESSATRRMSNPAGRQDHRPPEIRSSGPVQRFTPTNPAGAARQTDAARQRISGQDDGVIEICFEYLDEYRI